MRNILTSAAAAMALSLLAASAPAHAQTTFESVYAQPAEMVDGVDIGGRIAPAHHIGAATGAKVQRPRAGDAYGRRHNSRHMGA